jgi:pyruvate dehydrogenase E2 component (dihydrolipoamide acetyltransferase)
VETSDGAATAPVNADAGAAPTGNSGGGTQKAEMLGGMGAEQQGTTSLSSGSNGSGANGSGANGSAGDSNGALQRQAADKGTAGHEPQPVLNSAPAGRDGYTSDTAPGVVASPGGASTQIAPARNASSIPAAPSVRRLARELGVDLGQVQG